MLLLHGNAGNISHRLHYYQALLETGVNVFCFDYRGYGRSAGRPSEEGTYLDAQAAVNWLAARGFVSTEIVLLGKSLGGGIASELALREPVGGLILQNTFQSIPAVGKELFPFLPVARMASIHYDTHVKLPRIKVPVLIMHSRKDEFIGFHHGERNYAVANDPKMFWELDGGHNETLTWGKANYLQGLDQFLARFFAPGTRAESKSTVHEP
jgi:pimeloyl-ACP methyl ester carboxylesterase